MKGDRGGWRPLRREELRDELVHDPYRSGTKPVEPTRCPDCGAVFHDGRWQWATAPEGASEQACPACRRVRDHFPAGYIRLEGEFFLQHRDEILTLARHREVRETVEHALERIMAIEESDGGVLITTTGVHLARDVGEAVHAAYKGRLDYHYNKEQHLLRVNWQR